MKNTRSLLAVILACMMVMSCIVVLPAVAVGEAVGSTTYDGTYIAPATFAATWDGMTTATDWTGSGTEGDPYEITTAAQLAGLAEQVNGGTNYAGVYFQLGANLDLGNEEWTPIGYYGNSGNTYFRGTFDGNGKVIKNVYCTGANGNGYAGLFGYAGVGAIKNLTVTDSTFANSKEAGAIVSLTGSSLTIEKVFINNTTVDSSSWAGAIMGRPGSGTFTFNDCYVKGGSVGTAEHAHAGGIVGGASGGTPVLVVTDCTIETTVLSSARAGGIASYWKSTGSVTVTRTRVNSTITGGATSSSESGIFIGYVDSACTLNFTGCVASGTISNTGRGVGAFMGSTAAAANVNITGCYVDADISSTGPRVGGFVGSLTGGASSVVATVTVANSVFDGSVSGSTDVAGIVGSLVHNSNALNVTNTVVLGTITSSGNKGVVVGNVGATKAVADTVTINSLYHKTNVTNLGNFAGTTEDATPEANVASATYITPNASDANFAKAADYTIETFLPAFKSAVSAYAWYADTECVSHNEWEFDAEGGGTHTLSCDRLCPDASIVTGDTIWDGTYSVAWYVGHESDSSYDITTAEQLAGLAMIVAGLAEDGGTPIAADNFNGKTIYLKNDLKLNSDEDIANLGTWGTSAPANKWFPIGNYDDANFSGDGAGWKQFQGTFDGEGHTISGLYCNGQDTYFETGKLYYAALFGTVNTLSNLTLRDSYVYSGTNATGAIAATHRGAAPVFTNVNVENVTVVSNNNYGTALLMGRTGTISNPSFTDCSVSGAIGSDGSRVNYVGGIIGNSSANITNGIVSGCTVSGTYYGAASVGGILGGNEGGTTALTVSGTTVDGTFDASGAGVGGMFGLIKNASNITVGSGSVSAATVNAPTGRGGGIFGQTAGATAVTISGATFSGAVFGIMVGGMFGEVNSTGDVVIENSTFSGTVTSSANSNFYGGVIAVIGTSATGVNVSMTNVKTTSAASVSGYDYVGMLVGATRANSTLTFTNCEVDGSITGRNILGGVLGGRHGATPTVSCDGVYVKATFTGSAYFGGLVGRDASGTMALTATNCRIEPSSASVYAFLASSVAGTTVTVGNNVVVGDAAGCVQGSATVTQSSGTKVYAYGTVGATTGVDAITAADDAVVTFVPAWNGATAGYTSWTEAAGGTKSEWYETTGGYYRLSALQMYRGTTVETNKFLFETVGGSVRYTEPYGFRFGARIKGTDLEAGTFGMLIIPTDMLAGDLTITTPQVLNIVAAKTFGAGDTSGMYKDGYTAFTGVVTNIPESGYNRALTAVAYCTYDDVTYYSDAMTGSYYQVAKILLQNDGWVAENPAAATVLEGIVATVEG